MGRTIGVLATRHIWVGLVEDNRLVDPLHVYPDEHSEPFDLKSLPADGDRSNAQCELIVAAAARWRQWTRSARVSRASFGTA